MTKYKSNNILIIVFSLFLIFAAGIGIFSYSTPPTDLKETTGIIQSYNQHDARWHEYVFSDSAHSYFNVRLENGAFFEATGISYNEIDRVLFDELKNGEEITLIYQDYGQISPNKIHAIRYHGKDYLLLDDVFEVYEQNARTIPIFCSVIIAFSAVTGTVLLILNRKKNLKST